MHPPSPPVHPRWPSVPARPPLPDHAEARRDQSVGGHDKPGSDPLHCRRGQTVSARRSSPGSAWPSAWHRVVPRRGTLGQARAVKTNRPSAINTLKMCMPECSQATRYRTAFPRLDSNRRLGYNCRRPKSHEQKRIQHDCTSVSARFSGAGSGSTTLGRQAPEHHHCHGRRYGLERYRLLRWRDQNTQPR